MELLPNSMSFRVINTIDITDDNDIPADFTGVLDNTDVGARIRRAMEAGN